MIPVSASPSRPRAAEARPIPAEAQAGIAGLPPGSAVGSFVLHEVLTEDECGRCYRASASASDNEVVIEEYLPAAIARREADGTLGPRSPSLDGVWAEGLQAFVQEAEQLARLNHPALLRIGAVWQVRGTAYRLRAGGEGRPLAELVDAMTAPPGEAWLRSMLLPLLGALQAMHEAGWVHGNVRPGQIRVRADGSPVLLDSGAVRGALGARLPGWDAQGPEPGFLPPELTDDAQGGPVGPWSDLHALAQVLRYCLTGQAPLPPDVSSASQAEASPLLGPRSLAARYSPGLVAALERSLALDPRQRPQSVAEFLQILEAPVAAKAVPAASAGVLPFEPPHREGPRGAAPLQFPKPAAREPGAAFAAPLEPGWGPAAPAGGAGHYEPQVFELPDASGAAAAHAGAWTVGRDARRARRWPWALGGMLAGAALTGALVFVALERSGQVQFVLPPLAGASPGSEVLPRLDPGERAAGTVLPSTPLPPGEQGTDAAPPAATGMAAAPAAANAEREAPASMVREARVRDPAAPAPARSDAGAAAPAASPEEPATAAQAAAAPTDAPARTPDDAPADDGAAVAQADDDRVARPDTPAEACAPRSNFALYRCMQTQCEQGRFYTHPQCIRLRVRDELP